MPKLVLIDEIHLTISIPRGLDAQRVQVIRRTLRSRRFLVRLENAIANVIVKFPTLAKVRFKLSR